jgi:hypothetical protein
MLLQRRSSAAQRKITATSSGLTMVIPESA